MIRYICDYCGVPFDKPIPVHYTERVASEIWRSYTEHCCPFCGGTSFRDAKLCPDCGEVMEADEIICKSCAKKYMKRIMECFDNFTAEGEEWFNQLMDGEVIENREKWASAL